MDKKLLDGALSGKDSQFNVILQNTSPQAQAIRAFLELLWEDFSKLADRNFRTRVPDDLQSCFWEMYLAYCLIHRGGFNLNSENYGPDLLVTPGHIWIECVVATNGNPGHPDSVPPYSYLVLGEPSTYEATRVPTDKITLRLTNALAEKLKKFEKYVAQGLIKPDEPCIIALNAGNVNYSDTDLGYPRILAALFPLGSPYVAFDRNNGQPVSEGYSTEYSIRKHTGAQIGKEFFMNPQNASISGVIYSTASPFKCTDPEKAGVELIYVENPHAKNKVDPFFLKVGSTCSITILEDSLCLKFEQIE